MINRKKTNNFCYEFFKISQPPNLPTSQPKKIPLFFANKK